MFIMYMYLVLSRIVTISAGTLILFKDSHHIGQAGFFLFSKEWLFIFSEFGKKTLKRRYIHRGTNVDVLGRYHINTVQIWEDNVDTEVHTSAGTSAIQNPSITVLQPFQPIYDL